ncbi:MAG TPA: ATP-binding protein [Candidatus Saccharimonadales bacterium]|nr:ATP-binding protein [Candidatus Saccharimonadales bacterium]
MLIQFRTSNSFSFKDTAELSMVASADKTHDNVNTFVRGGVKFLKSAVIYGANGSGKTNLTNSFGYMRSLVLSHTDLRNVTFKLDKSCANKPSYFEVTFYNHDGLRCRYGFEVSEDRVIYEWLFHSKSSRETKIFTREKNGVDMGRHGGKYVKDEPKNNQLLIALLANQKMQAAQDVVRWFKDVNLRSGLVSSHMSTLEKINNGNKEDKKKVLDILHSFDIQMEDFIIKERPREPISTDGMEPAMASLVKAVNEFASTKELGPQLDVFTVRKEYHDGKDIGTVELDLLENESDGTKKLFELASYVVDALDVGGVLIIDELESKLHPLVTKELVCIFNSSDKNKNNAQLIFTTHDTNLLRGGHLRRDQIWFTEKDKYGASHLYSLAEYKEKPRKDASLDKDYVKGRFGAIPFIGDFTELLKR